MKMMFEPRHLQRGLWFGPTRARYIASSKDSNIFFYWTDRVSCSNIDRVHTPEQAIQFLRKVIK